MVGVAQTKVEEGFERGPSPRVTLRCCSRDLPKRRGLCYCPVRCDTLQYAAVQVDWNDSA